MTDAIATVTCVCGTKYRVPEAARGKRVRCKKCGQVMLVPAKVADADQDPLLDLGDLAKGEAVKTTGLSGAGAHADMAVVVGPTASGMLPPGAAVTVGYAPGAAPAGPRRYGAALLRLVRVPSNVSGALTLLGLCILLIIEYIGGGFLLATGSMRLSLLALVMFIVGEGSAAAFSIGVIQQTAEGEDALPGLPLSLSVGVDEWWQAFLAPLLAYVGTGLIALGPAIAYGIYVLVMASGGGVAFSHFVILMVLLLGGLFLWPMVVLVVALRGFGVIKEVGPITTTMLRTLPAYICVVLLVYGSAVLAGFLIDYAGGSDTSGLVLVALFCVARVYTQTLAMRAIGVYYHLYQDRFDWL